MSAYDRRMPDAYEQMSRELAPYQGRPHPEARAVGDPAAGTGAPPASDPDVARAQEVAHAYRQVGASSIAAPELTSDVAKAQVEDAEAAARALAERIGAPEGIIPTTAGPPGALAEATMEAGGALVPPTYSTRRRR